MDCGTIEYYQDMDQARCSRLNIGIDTGMSYVYSGL